MERSETMLNKKFFLVFAFFMLVAVSLNFGSAYVSLNPWNAILGGNINFSISDSSFSPFVYFYDYSGHFLETVNLGCGGVSGYCSGPQTFSVPLSSSIFPLGVYRFDIYSYSQNSWISTYFDVSSYSSYTKTCSDGTVAGTCSSTKPLDCLGSSLDSGALGFVNNCQLCGCDSGYVCQSDGSCSQSSSPASSSSTSSSTAPPQTTSGCTDSDNGNIYTQGTVTTSTGSYSDTCSPDGKALVDGSCYDSNTIGIKNVACSAGCVNGACVMVSTVPVINNFNPPTSINEGQVYGYQVNASSPIGAPLVYSLSGGASWLSINATGFISGTAPNFLMSQISMSVAVSDGIHSSSEEFMLNITPPPCSDGTPADQCSATKPLYCDSIASDLTDNCQLCGCSDGGQCVSDGACFSVPPVGPNEKYSALYSPKETFLVSDANWRDVLPMVSATTWTDSNGNVQKYPLLIYHDEGNDIFDADSAIYFLQQYLPNSLTLIGDTPHDLDNLLVASPSFGAGLQQSQIQRIHPSDYLNYWKSFNSVVYVADNYTLALLASTYASLINAPLIIQGSNLDSSGVFSGRSVICVGNVNPSGASCSETYTLEQLQNKYQSETGTDKIIIVNPSDNYPRGVWGYSSDGSPSYYLSQCPDKSPYCISQIYVKTSLIAPILASAKHELILSINDMWDINPADNQYYYLGSSGSPVPSFNSIYYSAGYKNGYQGIGSFIHSRLSGMNYLTIMASPYAIPIFGPYDLNTLEVSALAEGGYTGYSLDSRYYADLNGDGKPDVAEGRIAGISTSDISSYVARDLFLSSFPKTNNIKLMGSSFDGFLAQMVNNIVPYFQDVGYNTHAATSSDSMYMFNPDEWKQQDLIFYADHGSEAWAGVWSTDELASEQQAAAAQMIASGTATYLSQNTYYATGIPELNNSLVVIAACDTVSSQDGSSFWANAIRKGAIGYFGAVSTTSLDVSASNFISFVYHDNYDLGNAFKDAYDPGLFQSPMTLIGDPTLNISPPHLLYSKINLLSTVLCQPTGSLCGLGILNCCAGNVCSWFTCHRCLSSGTTVDWTNSNLCCSGSTQWVTRQDANFCCYNKPTYVSQVQTFPSWCANGKSTCWPWDWRAGWDAAHCGTHSTQHYDWGCWWNANYCGTHSTNDHKVCT
ncbi:MAG: hypothetical protein M1165_00295 [Candidatus Pacearchaeota archaeon]|nr:hypothetical protein [Candidatus Pacearchaeota archaeon]